MAVAMKYIMLKAHGRLVPFIFPEFLIHDEVAKAVREILDPNLQPSTVESAGKVNLYVVSTFDKSGTLAVSSKPEDASVINCYDYANGMDVPLDRMRQLVLISHASALGHQLHSSGLVK